MKGRPRVAYTPASRPALGARRGVARGLGGAPPARWVRREGVDASAAGADAGAAPELVAADAGEPNAMLADPAGVAAAAGANASVPS